MSRLELVVLVASLLLLAFIVEVVRRHLRYPAHLET